MNVLLIFIKNPQLGKVKTRLARTMGDRAALRIYHHLLRLTRAAALGAKAERWLLYSDFIKKKDQWRCRDFVKTLQCQDPDLGVRMEQAFANAFALGAQKVVIIGSDCPQLSPDILNATFDHLDTADYVLGPVLDGGYYLLGMRQFDPSVFRGVAWSTDTVLATTLAIIQHSGKSVALLPELFDVDTEADWKQWLL